MTKREAARLRAKVRAMRSGVVEAIGLLTLGDPLRAKEALAETYERSWAPEGPTRISGSGSRRHDDRLREAGVDPNAMTTSEVVHAQARGLLPGLCPGFTLVATGDGRALAARRDPAATGTLELAPPLDERHSAGPWKRSVT